MKFFVHSLKPLSVSASAMSSRQLGRLLLPFFRGRNSRASPPARRPHARGRAAILQQPSARTAANRFANAKRRKKRCTFSFFFAESVGSLRNFCASCLVHCPLPSFLLPPGARSLAIFYGHSAYCTVILKLAGEPGATVAVAVDAFGLDSVPSPSCAVAPNVWTPDFSVSGALVPVIPVTGPVAPAGAGTLNNFTGVPLVRS